MSCDDSDWPFVTLFLIATICAAAVLIAVALSGDTVKVSGDCYDEKVTLVQDDNGGIERVEIHRICEVVE